MEIKKVWIWGSSHESLVLFSGCHHWYMPLLLTNLNILPAWPDKLSQPRVFFFCPCSSRTIAHAGKKVKAPRLIQTTTHWKLYLCCRGQQNACKAAHWNSSRMLLLFLMTHKVFLWLLNVVQGLKRSWDCWQYRKCCTVVHNTIFIETYIWFYSGHSEAK